MAKLLTTALLILLLLTLVTMISCEVEHGEEVVSMVSNSSNEDSNCDENGALRNYNKFSDHFDGSLCFALLLSCAAVVMGF